MQCICTMQCEERMARFCHMPLGPIEAVVLWRCHIRRRDRLVTLALALMLALDLVTHPFVS